MSELSSREKVAILKKYGTCTITNRSHFDEDELSLFNSSAYWMQLKTPLIDRPYIVAATTRDEVIDRMYEKIRLMMRLKYEVT